MADYSDGKGWMDNINWMYVIIAIVIIYIIYTYSVAESFANKGEKAGAIWRWFQVNSDSRGHLNSTNSYGSFKASLGKDANITEYERIVNLAQTSTVSPQTIMQILS
jgi:hypothetical protein